MSGTEQAASGPAPLLFLIADTGGGHRNAARSVGQAIDLLYPGRFVPVLCDPLGGPGAAPLLRWVAGLYGPAIRLAPWLWGAVYQACDSRPAMGLLRRTLLRLADRPAADAARAHRPAAIVSFHPLTGPAAVAARDQGAPGAPVVTVVTDLARMHAAWRHADTDLIIAPPGAAFGRRRPRQPSGRGWAAAWSPVTREFWGGPLRPHERAVLRRSLGLRGDTLLVLLAGGGEGSGGIARRAVAILRRFTDVDVVAVCGHNRRLKRRLDRLAGSCGGRLTVTGFAHNMADLLRCSDLVVTKAGPGTIAEATCCGVPLLLTSHVPGQERGNTEFVTAADAGRHVPTVRRLVAEIGRLRDDSAAAATMRAAAARLGRPGGAADIAELIVGLTVAAPAPGARTSAAPAVAAAGQAGPARPAAGMAAPAGARPGGLSGDGYGPG
jgi:1,2-diacylglycerol 3-beta-galactosyltransferase